MKRYLGLIQTGLVAAMTCLPAVGYVQPLPTSPLARIKLATPEVSRVTQSVDSKTTVLLANTRSPLARLGHIIGTPDASAPVGHMQLVLKRSDQRAAALAAYTTAQQDPHSAYFHQWLSAEAYGKSFGVTDQDIAAATAWLKSAGFTVNVIYPSKMQIDFSGTVAQVNAAFSARQVRVDVHHETHIANAADISIPAALAPIVAGVAGLSDLHPKAMHTPISHSANMRGAISRLPARLPGATDAKISVAAKSTTTSAAIGFANAITTNDGARNLAPDDLQTIYNIQPLHQQGITGAGINITVIEDSNMVPSDWYDFVSTFHLNLYGGTFRQINPNLPLSFASNCSNPADPTADNEDGETTLDAEWSTAMAPGANITVATCDDANVSNFFGGAYVAALNTINGTDLPDIISASYGYDELDVDSASTAAIHNMWQQAAAEGISVFVSTGDSGSNAGFNGLALITEPSSANVFATSPFVTAVGGTDFADALDGTTDTYFTSQANYNYGTALSYVPEIPWNSSCGNSVGAKALGYANSFDFCNDLLSKAGGIEAFFYYSYPYEIANPFVFVAEGASAGASSFVPKPSWQGTVFGASSDQFRDIPDVALYGGSFTAQDVVFCTAANPCQRGVFPNGVAGVSGTSLSSPMFAGIQALVNQAAAKGKQGVSAPILYALAAQEYGNAGASAPPATLAACSADNGTNGTSACVFHNVVRGGVSTNCFTGVGNCTGGIAAAGLTSQSNDSYVEYAAHPGWSIAAGLGSVNATNLVNAWVAYLKQSTSTK